MIEVYVQYFNKRVKCYKNDYFIFTRFIVKGHANNGSSQVCMKVCAGISACVIGIRRIIDDEQYSVKYKSGLFDVQIKAGRLTCNNKWVDQDTCYGLNTLLCQLYDLYLLYPSQFSKFEMYEVKENELLNYEQSNNKSDTKPKPFRKQLDIHSSYKRTYRKKNR